MILTMQLYHFLLIVEDFGDKYKEEFLRDRILPIENFYEIMMVVKIYVQYFPIDIFFTDH